MAFHKSLLWPQARCCRCHRATNLLRLHRLRPLALRRRWLPVAGGECVDLVSLDHALRPSAKSGIHRPAAPIRPTPYIATARAPAAAALLCAAASPSPPTTRRRRRCSVAARREPAVLEPGVRHADEQTLIAPSPLGGPWPFCAARPSRWRADPRRAHSAPHRRLAHFRRRALAARRRRRGARAARRWRARTRVYWPAAEPRRFVAALPELWSDGELALLQDDALVDLAKAAGTGAALEAWHAELAAAHSWNQRSRSTRCAGRALLVSAARHRRRARGTSAPLLLAALHRHGEHSPRRRSASRTCGSPPSALTRCPPTCGFRARDSRGARRGSDVAEGEELLLDYGLDLTRTTVRYALLNYGIVASLDAASFRQQSLPRDPEGSLLCAPLCIDNAPGLRWDDGGAPPAQISGADRDAERLLNTAPWNATTVDDDLGELIVARHALSSLPPTTAGAERVGRSSASRRSSTGWAAS